MCCIKCDDVNKFIFEEESYIFDAFVLKQRSTNYVYG